MQLVAHDSETLVGWLSPAFTPSIPEPTREENVLLPRFFLPFSLLDVPLISRGLRRDFSGNPGPLEELKFFLTFFRLDVP